jgi:hypothetical protein
MPGGCDVQPPTGCTCAAAGHPLDLHATKFKGLQGLGCCNPSPAAVTAWLTPMQDAARTAQAAALQA